MKTIKEYINESKEYSIMFLQYDPNVKDEYENGDATDDELHDSMYESDKVKRVKFDALDDRMAVSKATKIIAKEVNKHPELCGGSVYCGDPDDGDIVETILL